MMAEEAEAHTKAKAPGRPQSLSHSRGLSSLTSRGSDPLPAFSLCRLPQAVSTEEKEFYRMSAVYNLHSFDLLPAGTEDYIHIRIQQRNGWKPLTTVQGIADDYDKKKLVKALKKKFASNGTVMEHRDNGEVIQLQGAQHRNICQFLVETGLAKDDQLEVHGF